MSRHIWTHYFLVTQPVHEGTKIVNPPNTHTHNYKEWSPLEITDSTLQLLHKAVEDTATADHLCP